MAQVIRDLPPLRFDDLRAPCETTSFNFSHGQGRLSFPYTDGAGHDWTGLEPIKMPVKLFFLNTVEPDSFPNNWNLWQARLFDGSPGNLDHPVLGRVRAVVLEGDVEVTAQSKSGVVVNVTFERHLDSPDEAATNDVLVVSTAALAEAADQAIEDFDEIEPPGTSLVDSVNGLKGQIEGAIFSAELSVTGAINRLQGVVTGLIDTAAAITSPESWVLTSHLIKLWNALEIQKRNADRLVTRATRSIVVQADTTLDDVARSRSNTIDEIMNLNPELLRRPSVPRGAIVRFYV